jgi:hypothetical protein
VWVAGEQRILSSMRALHWRQQVLGTAVCVAGVSVALAMTAGQAWSASSVDYDKDGFTEAQGDCRPLDPAVGPAALDRPESRAPFEDSNCDGIDGDRQRAVFLSAAAGDDANPGTMEQPVRTLAAASLRAQDATDGKDLYLAVGDYDGLSSFPADVRGVFGGYLQDASWARTDDPTETRTNRGFSGLDVSGSARRLVLQLVSIGATPNPAVSRSAYGLRVFNGARVALEHARVFAANGAEGASAFATTTPPAIANRGQNGTARDCSQSSDVGVGGAGGSGSATGGRGGDAGTINAFTLVAESGASGSGIGAGTGGAGGKGEGFFPAAVGKPGTSGANGQGGVNGRPQVNVIPAGGVTQWIGEDGTPGAAGAGGGGGGAGGSFVLTDGSVNPPAVSIVNGGGGGGAGGAGGAGGGGGQAGGASIALFVTGGSSILLTDDTIIGSGSGGAGGNGATGQPGAAGALFGIGADPFASCAPNAFAGGGGGAGGDGGTGGPGGGGPGGPSFGVFAAGSTVQLSGVAGFPGSNVPIQTGAGGGLGGLSGLGVRAGPGPSAQVFKNGAVVPVASADDQGVADFDDDGVVDRDDRCRVQSGSVLGCPARPAALPDRDGDGVPDADDACPDNSSASALPCAAPSPTPSPTPPEVDRLAPTLSALKVAPSRIRVRRGSTVGRPRRIRLEYALSEAATVRLTLVRVRPGRREGGRCVAPRPGATGNRCRRLITILARTRNGAPGVNTSRLRLSRRLLRPGRYRVRARATDAAGNRGAMRSVRLRIVRAARR